MQKRKWISCVLAMLYATSVFAAPDEVQVYNDEMNAPGEFGLEQHVNYTVKGQRTPDYAGQMVSHHLTQITPEFSYGINRNFEGGLYLPLAVAPGGNAYLNGLRLRLKYMRSVAEDSQMFYGLNGELGRSSIRTSDSLSSFEIRPIIGYRGGNWLASFNPILNFSLAAAVSHQPTFLPSMKLARRMSEGVSGGLEYYGEYGALNNMLPGSQRAHMLYAVADVASGKLDLNVGIGRGFVNAPDQWVLKALVALPLD
ncbi:MAG: hypothetical protein A2342_05420 [Gallionellales bacterium RIFOXYB12_FULL_54_9]|nr:MAG: hypothetical protein A2342_05420 [Gallionellales bacterium RIFOXYB12_FULL_54_9]